MNNLIDNILLSYLIVNGFIVIYKRNKLNLEIKRHSYVSRMHVTNFINFRKQL